MVAVKGMLSTKADIMAATQMIKPQAITKLPAERSRIQSAIKANRPLDSTAPTRMKRKMKNIRVGHSMSFSINSIRFTFSVMIAIVKSIAAPIRAATLTSMCQYP